MIIYKDLFGSNDEMASDTYKCKIIDEVILEIEAKNITYVPGKIDDALLGANASAENDDGGNDDEQMVTGCNLVLAHRLVPTSFDKKLWTKYIKDFMKSVLKKLEDGRPERAAIFKAKAQPAVKKILSSFKDWEMYTGESMDVDGSIAYLNYREDGITPYLWFFIDGLEQEKV